MGPKRSSPERLGTETKPPYEKLLSCERRTKSGVEGRTLQGEADSDRGRVLFCAPFRRLQNKAQVFSLETNAAVRSRLTHSIEVSSVGRFVAQEVIRLLPRENRKTLGLLGRESAFVSFVETACLLHDIGNPPFGHFAELTISDWFRANEEQFKDALDFRRMGSELREAWTEKYKDLTHFDGNPQGLRIVVHLQPTTSSDPSGLNLTLTQLAAMIKYPWSTAELHGNRYKAGYFQTERPLIDRIRQSLGVEPGRRHPLVYLMEAADDIAYCLSDLEDGLEKRLIDRHEFGQSLKKEFDVNNDGSAEAQDIGKRLDQLMSTKPPDEIKHDPIWAFRATMVRLLAKRAATNFVERHETLLTGDAGEPLLGGKYAKYWLLKGLNDYAERSLYSSKIVRSREITAARVVGGLLEAYRPLLACDQDRFESALSGNRHDHRQQKITVESAYASYFAPKHLRTYLSAVGALSSKEPQLNVISEWMHRAHLVVDYVSGMTDEYALQIFHLVSGVHVDGHA